VSCNAVVCPTVNGTEGYTVGCGERFPYDSAGTCTLCPKCPHGEYRFSCKGVSNGTCVKCDQTAYSMKQPQCQFIFQPKGFVTDCTTELSVFLNAPSLINVDNSTELAVISAFRTAVAQESNVDETLVTSLCFRQGTPDSAKPNHYCKPRLDVNAGITWLKAIVRVKCLLEDPEGSGLVDLNNTQVVNSVVNKLSTDTRVIAKNGGVPLVTNSFFGNSTNDVTGRAKAKPPTSIDARLADLSNVHERPSLWIFGALLVALIVGVPIINKLDRKIRAKRLPQAYKEPFLKQLLQSHLWLSVVFRSPQSNFTSKERYLVVLLYVTVATAATTEMWDPWIMIWWVGACCTITTVIFRVVWQHSAEIPPKPPKSLKPSAATKYIKDRDDSNSDSIEIEDDFPPVEHFPPVEKVEFPSVTKEDAEASVVKPPPAPVRKGPKAPVKKPAAPPPVPKSRSDESTEVLPPPPPPPRAKAPLVSVTKTEASQKLVSPPAKKAPKPKNAPKPKKAPPTKATTADDSPPEPAKKAPPKPVNEAPSPLPDASTNGTSPKSPPGAPPVPKSAKKAPPKPANKAPSPLPDASTNGTSPKSPPGAPPVPKSAKKAPPKPANKAPSPLPDASTNGTSPKSPLGAPPIPNTRKAAPPGRRALTPLIPRDDQPDSPGRVSGPSPATTVLGNSPPSRNNIDDPKLQRAASPRSIDEAVSPRSRKFSRQGPDATEDLSGSNALFLPVQSKQLTPGERRIEMLLDKVTQCQKRRDRKGESAAFKAMAWEYGRQGNHIKAADFEKKAEKALKGPQKLNLGAARSVENMVNKWETNFQTANRKSYQENLLGWEKSSGDKIWMSHRWRQAFWVLIIIFGVSVGIFAILFGEAKSDMMYLISTLVAQSLFLWEPLTFLAFFVLANALCKCKEYDPSATKKQKQVNKSVEKQSKKQNDDEDEENLCKICFDSPMDCIVLPCAHMSMCYSCSRSVKSCPVCRGKISEIKKVFKA